MAKVWMRPGKGSNFDPKVKLMRQANTAANNRYGVGGRLKGPGKLKPVTLPSLKFMDYKPL